MKYQKPKVVAKSAPKQSFVAGCPERTPLSNRCDAANRWCSCGPLS